MLAVEVNSPLDNSEPKTAVSLIDRVKRRFGLRPATVGADKGYDQGPFLLDLERRTITPHVAVKAGPIGGVEKLFAVIDLRLGRDGAHVITDYTVWTV